MKSFLFCFFILLFLGWGQSVQAQVVLDVSNLPILLIDTNNEEILDEPKIDGTLQISYQGPGELNEISGPFGAYDGFVGIELRGASSQWAFPKKGYGLETRLPDGSNNNVELLGLPKENDWVLNGPYSDKALIRNALAYTLAAEIMEYAPRVVFCELVLNGDYQGIYLLTEKIKRDNDRVDVKENITDDLDGGFIIKIDKQAGGSNLGWYSHVSPITDPDYFQYYQYHYPKAENITESQESTIRSYIDEFEEIMDSKEYKDSINGYPSLIDEQSFIDFILINEISKNVDAYRLSTFLHKNSMDFSDEIKAGPVWDFNLSFGNADYCTDGNPEGWVISNFNFACPDDIYQIPFWWNKLLKDENFNSKGRARWLQLRATSFSQENMHDLIDSLSFSLASAQSRNFEQWPVLDEYVWPNYYVGGSYEAEIMYLKNWVTNRLQWMDKYYTQLFSFFPSIPSGSVYHIYPNPVKDWMTLEYYLSTIEPVQLRIYAATGDLIMETQISDSSLGYNTAYLNLESLSSGVYFIQLMRDSKSTVLQKFTKF